MDTQNSNQNQQVAARPLSAIEGTLAMQSNY
jgi:hypothetical protein